MGHKELRQEFTRPTFRIELKDKLGNICVNCGSDKHIEYHHIVPLKNGGTNRLTNIVPLCEECHCKAHDKAFMNNKSCGRPKAIEYENAEPILHRYFNMEIGKKETKELLGIKGNSTWDRLIKEYKDKHNIGNFYNRIDLKNSQVKRLETIINK